MPTNINETTGTELMDTMYLGTASTLINWHNVSTDYRYCSFKMYLSVQFDFGHA